MRTKIKKVIIGILIGIAICVVIYVKYFMFVPDKGGMINENMTEIEETSNASDIEFGRYKTYE
ncbi:MAG: hypothetical protein ACI4XD_01085 [Clostridia bacterium]|jgi:hypothetical protein